MAKKPQPRKRRFNLRKVRIAASVVVGALAASDVVVGAISGTLSEKLRIVSTELTYNLSDLGAEIDDGQEFGLSHSDYTAPEVEEALEATASMDQGDKISSERANRLVRTIGFMTGSGPADTGRSHNDGKPVKTRLNWALTTGDTLNAWIRNGSDSVYTSGATLDLIGHVWVRD